MRAFLISLALGAVAITNPVSAQASTDEGLATIAVRYVDLDLGSASGKAALASRLRGAAAQLCSDYVISPIERAERAAGCKAQVFNSAKRQLNLALAAGGGGFPPAAR